MRASIEHIEPSVSRTTFHAPTVLVVDDDELVLARLGQLIGEAGFKVHTASGGVEAIRCLETSRTSIVIADLNMPGIDGLTLCRRIREHSWPEYIYVILLTIRDDEDDIVAGLEAGADDYLSKRTSEVQLKARLQTARRITELQRSLTMAIGHQRHLAMTDALTGTYNRRYFTLHLERELKRTRRFGGDLSLLLLDIDHFKRVNDTFGHAIGDRVLKCVTKTIADNFQRATDWCARIGGEEFAIVLEGTNSRNARQCAEKLRRAIAASSVPTPMGVVRITASIGVSGLAAAPGKNPDTVESLLAMADKRLYSSKSRGRNRVTFTDFRQASLEVVRRTDQ